MSDRDPLMIIRFTGTWNLMFYASSLITVRHHSSQTECRKYLLSDLDNVLPHETD